MVRSKVTIEGSYDGWAIWIHERRYDWNHNDEDLGVRALERLFEGLGYDVDLQDVC